MEDRAKLIKGAFEGMFSTKIRVLVQSVEIALIQPRKVHTAHIPSSPLVLRSSQLRER